MTERNADTGKIIYLTDRSAAETDDICGMRYWFNRKEGPAKKGIVPKEEALALRIGRETHVDLCSVAQMEDLREDAIKEVIYDLLSGISPADHEDQDNMELVYRRLGWLAAWALFVEPRIRERYRNVQVEDEIILERDPLYVAVTPDRILEDRETGELEYREYKTTISATTKWMHSWFFAIQLHIGLAAAMEELEREVKFAQIQALMKGDKSRMDGHLVHPYVWGYYGGEGKWEHSYDKARGSSWQPMPIWEFPGGIVEWVKQCGPEVALAQFPLSPPVFLNLRMLDHWIRRRTAREQQIRSVEEACRRNPQVRAVFFEERTRNCRPAFGDACPYINACWNAGTNADPMHSGLYLERTPHHDVEIIGLDGNL